MGLRLPLTPLQLIRGTWSGSSGASAQQVLLSLWKSTERRRGGSSIMLGREPGHGDRAVLELSFNSANS